MNQMKLQGDNMPRFGKTSKARLATCHEDLQEIFNEVIKYFVDLGYSIHRIQNTSEPTVFQWVISW